jgi:hypothetical protein
MSRTPEEQIAVKAAAVRSATAVGRGALALALLAGCGGGSTSPGPRSSPPPVSPSTASVPPVAPPALPDETALLDAAYRIDVDRIEAVFDVFPGERRVEARAGVDFRMRPGQSRPIFHFDPARGTGVSLALDGEGLAPGDEADVRFFTWEGSGQVSMEIERDLSPGSSHRLEAAYTLPMSDGFGRFHAEVNDLQGHGNETLFPTINSPRDLARHVIVLRVHDAEPYQCVGSGQVVRTDAADVQEWVLDTEREVASYTVLFYLVPDQDVVADQRTIQGVDVRVLGYPGAPAHEEAFAQLDPWLAELRNALGPFPMPRGLSVVLTPTGGGMEYYGGTITSLRALRHEVFHMYYGCSTVARTYRDSWWDEAINMWYELSADPSFPPIDPGFRSGIVGARTPLTVGFDQRAYDEGARVIQSVATEMGGRGAAVAFLRHLHLTRSFDPFTTEDLANEILAYSGADFRDRFHQWLYAPTETAGRGPARWRWLDEVDLTPPPQVRQRHLRASPARRR